MSEQAGFSVTIERWEVFQAWRSDHVVVQRWAICHDGMPLLAIHETDEAARAQAEAWGWTIVEPSETEG